MLIFLWTAAEVGSQTDLFGNHLTRTVASLVNAWVVIRLVSGIIRHEVLARFIAWTAWTLAALTTLGLFDATVALLDGMAMTIGAVRVSVLTVVKGVMALGILLWVTVSISNVLERRIGRAESLTPSVQVLVAKLTKIVLITLAFLIAINSLGIDLTALTVFGGALGVGIGFGLQKIIANLMSGLTLLMDKSIKPNDVIAVGETYGWIVSLGARYTAVRTRDGVEHLIPNEDLIAQRVEKLVAQRHGRATEDPCGDLVQVGRPSRHAPVRGGGQRRRPGARHPRAALPAQGIRRQLGEPRDSDLDRRPAGGPLQCHQSGAARGLGSVPRARDRNPLPAA